MENEKTELKVGQEVYYRGLNWGHEETIWKRETKDGEVFVTTTQGVKRKEKDVLSNSCDLYVSKDEINKSLAGVWMGRAIK